MTEESHVLVIFPHPDDESFSSAGTLARYIDNGVPVTYACLTLGQMGRNLGNPPFATRESLPDIREQELENAMEAIGITALRNMGLRDKMVGFEQTYEMDGKLDTLIDDLPPSLIPSFSAQFAVDPDHQPPAEAVVRTVGRIAQSERPRLQLLASSTDAHYKLGAPDT